MWPGGLRQQRVDSSTRHDLPPTSICIRPTDRPIYASRPRLVRGLALSSLPPSLNRYIPPPAQGGIKSAKCRKKTGKYTKKGTPRHQMTKNERRVGGGCYKEAGQKAAGETISPQQSPNISTQPAVQADVGPCFGGGYAAGVYALRQLITLARVGL